MDVPYVCDSSSHQLTHAPFLHTVPQNQLHPTCRQASTALAMLAALLSSDPTTVVADELYRLALPARILQELVDTPPQALMQVGRENTCTLAPLLYCHLVFLLSFFLSSCLWCNLEPLLSPPLQAIPATQATLVVIESRLALLLQLVLSGPPSQRTLSAQKLFSLQAISKLAACKALDTPPEEPGFGLSAGVWQLPQADCPHSVTLTLPISP